MEKIVYLLWTGNGEREEALTRRVRDEIAPALLARGPRALTVDLADTEVAAPVPWPGDEPPLVAVVSLWLDCYDRRAPFEGLLFKAAPRVAGYLVTESLYSDYGSNRHSPPRDWPDGERSPGLLTVTLMERPERLTPEEWLAHWHEVQSPVSEEMQPRTRYVRNSVVRPLTPKSPPYAGIVAKRHVELGAGISRSAADHRSFAAVSSSQRRRAAGHVPCRSDHWQSLRLHR